MKLLGRFDAVWLSPGVMEDHIRFKKTVADEVLAEAIFIGNLWQIAHDRNRLVAFPI
jgi:hypothetical protein